MPNQLSTEIGAPVSALQVLVQSPSQGRPVGAPRTVAPAPEQQARALPSAGTWIFIAFIVLTIFRCATRS